MLGTCWTPGPRPWLGSLRSSQLGLARVSSGEQLKGLPPAHSLWSWPVATQEVIPGVRASCAQVASAGVQYWPFGKGLKPVVSPDGIETALPLPFLDPPFCLTPQTDLVKLARAALAEARNRHQSQKTRLALLWVSSYCCWATCLTHPLSPGISPTISALCSASCPSLCFSSPPTTCWTKSEAMT